MFEQLSAIQRQHTYFTLEIYNPDLDHSKQIETPLIIDAIAYPNLAPKRYDENLFYQSLPKLDKQIDELAQTSQFDFELWFHLGQLQGAEYMIIAINPITFPLYYPIYSNRKGLLDRMLRNNPYR